MTWLFVHRARLEASEARAVFLQARLDAAVTSVAKVAEERVATERELYRTLARLEAGEEQRVFLQERLAVAETRLTALLDSLAQAAQARLDADAAKERTYTSPIPSPEMPDPLPVMVVEAISDRAAPNSPTWRHLEMQARQRLTAGVDPGEVAMLILNGEPVEW